MRLREVDLPEELITAQNEGDLVLFAGSGVSLDPPSNLPDFETLAREVAGPTDITRRGDESPDPFLGRLADRGVNVEARVRGIIDDEDSHPNQLHHLLLRLFPSAEDVRLVTTNFDHHFTSTVRDQYEEAVDIYHAPALPLGGNFQGLVYLHGAVGNPRSKLVLTDEDFGLAYLIDGWATDFLREMFAEFTVLFVGYSHEDRVVEYLARGLVSDTESRPAGNSAKRKSMRCQRFVPYDGRAFGIGPVVRPGMGRREHEQTTTDGERGWPRMSRATTIGRVSEPRKSPANLSNAI